MNYRRYLLVLAAMLPLTGCDQMQTALNPGAGSKTIAVTGDIIATVNGASITQQVLDIYIKQRQAKGAPFDESNPDAPLNELISLELMRQEAVNSGADADPVISATINQLERSTLAGAAIKVWMENNAITDEAVREAYDSKIGVPGTEYNARHILVETEEVAIEVIKMLDVGGDFEELAREKSTGPSGPNGGELGWFGAGQMVKPFSDATAKLEQGAYTKEPVQTQFGWHIIRLEDTRESTPPPFDDVKDRLKMMLANQQLHQHVEQIRSTAKIDIK